MSNSASFKIDKDSIVNAVGDEDVATGDLKFWPSETIPAGWLVRDGRALSRVAYAQLFAVLGTRYGAGDGATTFNIPDDRAEFIRGADMGRGVDVGRVVGSLQGHAIENHVHFVANGAADGLRTWDMTDMGNINRKAGMISHTNSGGGGLVGATSDVAGATAANETRPRNRAYVPLIKY